MKALNKFIILISFVFLFSGFSAAESNERQANIIDLLPEFERELPEPGMTPDSFFYGFKRFFERADLFFTFDSPGKAEKQLHLAELRISEARAMAEKNKPEFVEGLLEDYEKSLRESNKTLIAGIRRGRDLNNLLERVAIATVLHEDALDKVLEKVPEQARNAIEKAKETAKRGNQEALSSLEKTNPERTAEMHFRIAEKAMRGFQERVLEKPVDANRLLSEYRERIQKAEETAEKARERGRGTENLEQLIAERTVLHAEILDELLEKAPAEARIGIEKALDVSVKGYDRATDALRQKGLETSIPATAIPQRIRERVLGKSMPAYSVIVDPDKPPAPPSPGKPFDGESFPVYSAVVDPDKPPLPPR